MATNKMGLKTVEQFMDDYVPVYAPFYPILMSGKTRSHSELVGAVDFRRLEVVGDVRAKVILPKDTEIKQIQVRDGKKSFKKYFFGNQFVISTLQDQEGTNGVITQVLDEHHKQFDDIVLLGGGTSPGTVENNGLFYSQDSNYILQTSYEVPNTGSWLPGLHAKVIEQALVADRAAGRKVIVWYGSTILPVFNALYSASSVPFKSVLQTILGGNYQQVQLPPEVTPAGANGFMIVNLDQITTHYTAIPALKKQGTNEEMEYNWFNFLMGSAMVEVLAMGGIIKQPLTLQAP